MASFALKSPSEIFLDLIAQAECELEQAEDRYEECLNEVSAAMMVAMATADAEDRLLLEHEREILNNGELDRLRAEVGFWEGRLARLKGFDPSSFRPPCDEEPDGEGALMTDWLSGQARSFVA